MRRSRRLPTTWDAVFGALGLAAIAILFASNNPPSWYVALFGLICARDVWQWSKARWAKKESA